MCERSKGRFRRHASLNDVIKRALATANVPSVLEPTGLNRSDGTRPDGTTNFTWKYGLCLAWDVTVVDTLAISYIAHTTREAGWAADDAERRKVEKYAALQGRFYFNPVGFETFGSWGSGAKDLVKEVAAKIEEQTGESRAEQFLQQRISLEIQRGNAVSVLGTVDKPKSIDELFFLLGASTFLPN